MLKKSYFLILFFVILQNNNLLHFAQVYEDNFEEENCDTTATITATTTTSHLTTTTTSESKKTTEKTTATTTDPDTTTTIPTEPTTTPWDETTVAPETTTSPTTDPSTETTTQFVASTTTDEEGDYDGEDGNSRENIEAKSTKKMPIITATTPKIDAKIDNSDADSDFSENYGQNLRSFANWAQESWNGENTFKVDLFTIDGTTLLGNLTLGSPPLTVRVTFDQTTFTTWITGYHCVYTNGVTCFTQLHKYDPTLSYTATFLNRSMMLDYGNAMAKGEFVQELVVLGTQMSSSFPMFCNIGVANRLDTFFRDVLLDGVVGLAFPPANQTGFLEFLLHAQIFQKPIFSIWLNPRRNLTSDLVAGTIVFGRADKKNCGNVIGSARVVKRPLWEFKIDNITLNNFLIRREINAILDMGSSHIFVPKMDLAKIKKVLKLKNTVRIPCKKYMKLVLRSNRTRLIMKNNNLMRFLERKKTKKYCNLEIREGADDVWILGATFFRRFCVIHNFLKGIIGFAEHLD